MSSRSRSVVNQGVSSTPGIQELSVRFEKRNSIGNSATPTGAHIFLQKKAAELQEILNEDKLLSSRAFLSSQQKLELEKAEDRAMDLLDQRYKKKLDPKLLLP